jgi:hypothetical protein
MPELVGQHERVDANRCGSGRERVAQDLGMDRFVDLGGLGGLAEPLDNVGERIPVEWLVLTPLGGVQDSTRRGWRRSFSRARRAGVRR